MEIFSYLIKCLSAGFFTEAIEIKNTIGKRRCMILRKATLVCSLLILLFGTSVHARPLAEYVLDSIPEYQ
jgi:hypothetical protein